MWVGRTSLSLSVHPLVAPDGFAEVRLQRRLHLLHLERPGPHRDERRDRPRASRASVEGIFDGVQTGAGLFGVFLIVFLTKGLFTLFL